MKNILVLLAVFISLIATAHAVPIDFSSLSPGDSVEGAGTVHPLLEITSTNGAGVALFPGVLPRTYGAPNGSGSMPNGGISPGGGFGDINSARRHDFEFTFASGITVDAFSIRMVDYGDFNKAHATSHSVTLEALNALGVIVDSDVLSYTSTAATNPRSGSAGDLFLTGDAVNALPGEPGLFTFSLSGLGISKVRILYAHNGPDRAPGAPSDPNIAFDTLEIDFRSVPEPGSLALLLGGLAVWRFAR